MWTFKLWISKLTSKFDEANQQAQSVIVYDLHCNVPITKRPEPTVPSVYRVDIEQNGHLLTTDLEGRHCANVDQLEGEHFKNHFSF